MPSEIREMRTKIMHRILVRILAAQLVFKQRFKEVCGPSRTCVEEDKEGQENDIDSLAVTVG